MNWIQIETGVRNVQEASEGAAKYRLVVGYDITHDNYRVHIYKVDATGKAEMLDIDLTQPTLHEGFEAGKQVISDLF